MNKVSILLVDNPYFNITKIDAALTEAGLNYTLYFTGSGKNGLDILMGDPFHELIASDTVKIKPSVVILSKEIKDISALEFLGIVGKYYSLRDVKIFLLSDSLTAAEEQVYNELGVNGYLQRPLDKAQIVTTVKPQLENERRRFAVMPVAPKLKLAKVSLEAFVKGKVISMGLGAKIAASVASVLMVSSVAVYHSNNRVKSGGNDRPLDMPPPAAEQLGTTSPLILSADKPAAAERTGTAGRKESIPYSDPVAVVSKESGMDSIAAPMQKNENAVSANRLLNPRIVAVEESDSIPD